MTDFRNTDANISISTNTTAAHSTQTIKSCLRCHSPFEPRTKKQIYCSRECVHPSIDERLAAYHEPDPLTGCWNWTHAVDKEGYGFVKLNNRMERAHRVSYQMHVGNIDPGNVVMHKCDNPSCINPEHLKQGTHKENSQDASRKGRLTSWKLTTDEKLEILYFDNKYSSVYLSRIYNVTPSAIERLRRNRETFLQNN